MNHHSGKEVELTPDEFEQQVQTWLERAANSRLRKFSVTHLKKLSGPGGEYEIDAVAEFEVLGGAKIVVLVECKYYKHPIKRDIVMLLDAKLRETGAHKGIVFSTSNFQSGALQYAKAHGIATVLMQDGKAAYFTKAYGQTEPPPWYPKYKSVGWMLTLIDDERPAFHLIADDYLDAIQEWLHLEATE